MSISLPAGPLPSPADDIVPPLKNRPAMREPLPGRPEVDWDALYREGVASGADGWWGAPRSVLPATEDAARAMVAEMAKALGLTVMPAEDAGRLAAYDRELSAVMPADFKDWHENSPAEWPTVARLVIEGLRRVPCPGCGTTEPDIVVDGETQCGKCGMIGAPVAEHGA